MHTNGKRQFLSYLLLAAGALLLFLGARDYLGSQFGQTSAARQFVSAASVAQPPPAAARHPDEPQQRGDTVAKLVIPRLDAELYVVEGDDTGELRRGPGHISGTAMPGGHGNCVIAGHRDTHFRILKDIRKGDDIVLETRYGEFLYRVKSTGVISPRNNRPLRPTSGAELHLITCYPFHYVGAAPQRFIVEAQLAAAVAGESTSSLPPS